jgi:hypothetical protein
MEKQNEKQVFENIIKSINDIEIKIKEIKNTISEITIKLKKEEL